MKNFQKIMKFKRRCFFPSKDLWVQHYFFVTFESQRVNRNVKKQRKQQRGGREGRGDWGPKSFFVSFEAQMVNKSVGKKKKRKQQQGEGKREKRGGNIFVIHVALLRVHFIVIVNFLLAVFVF